LRGRLASWASVEALGVELEKSLRRLKQLLELGEIVRSDASIHKGGHPARPSWNAGQATGK
jgi:hypothetical protein